MRKSFLRDEAGAIAIVFALVFPVMVGALALGAEAGFWYYTKLKLQHAADLAAHAGAVRLRAGDAKADIEKAARVVAIGSGFVDNDENVTSRLTLNLLSYKGRESVEVILVEEWKPMLSSLFTSGPVPIRGSAVASLPLVPSSVACVLALDPVASGAVTVSGSASVALRGCDIASNSNAADSYLQASSSTPVSAKCIYAVGGASVGGPTNLECGAVRQYASATRDPYASHAAPTSTWPCVNFPNTERTLDASRDGGHLVNGTWVIEYCPDFNGVRLKGNYLIRPGLYIFNSVVQLSPSSDQSVTYATLSGTGVTFYFKSGSQIVLGSTATLNLTAPTTGDYAGLLFFGARDATKAMTITGHPESTLTGAIYFPAAPIEFRGNSSATNGCAQIIGRTVTFTGSSNIAAECEGTGARNISTDFKVDIIIPEE